jgi:hypothetical protein
MNAGILMIKVNPPYFHLILFLNQPAASGIIHDGKMKVQQLRLTVPARQPPTGHSGYSNN